MMRSNSHPILKHAFPKRVEALEAIASGDPARIEKAAASLAQAADTIGEAAAATAYRAYGKLAEAVARLARWKTAVRAAEADADRYLRSAKEIAKEALAVATNAEVAASCKAAASSIESVATAEDATKAIAEVARVSLPVPLLARPKSPIPQRESRRDSVKQPPQPEVFLEFFLDGQPFASPQIVSPGQLHDMSVNVIVKNWPASADRLFIHPTSVEQDGICNLPEFSLPKPAGSKEAAKTFNGRLSVTARQSISARPLEYCYRADFLPSAGPVRALVSGNGRLEIRSYDPALNPVSGYREVDMKLLELRDTVRKIVIVDDRQLADFLVVMKVLGRTAAKALQDADFKGQWDEKRFQEHMRAVLRGDPGIGAALEEHPHASGGITDLSFKQIRIELKAENKTAVDLEKALGYADQAAQYVAGSDRRLGALCVLDCSPKKSAVGLVANDIGVARVLPPKAPANAVPTTLGVVIVRGNLSSPSRL